MSAQAHDSSSRTHCAHDSSVAGIFRRVHGYSNQDPLSCRVFKHVNLPISSVVVEGVDGETLASPNHVVGFRGGGRIERDGPKHRSRAARQREGADRRPRKEGCGAREKKRSRGNRPDIHFDAPSRCHGSDPIISHGSRTLYAISRSVSLQGLLETGPAAWSIAIPRGVLQVSQGKPRSLKAKGNKRGLVLVMLMSSQFRSLFQSHPGALQ